MIKISPANILKATTPLGGQPTATSDHGLADLAARSEETRSLWCLKISESVNNSTGSEAQTCLPDGFLISMVFGS